MTAYDPEPWHDLFVAVAGASAALAGLLFVAVSINLSRILSFPGLPGRAAQTIGMLGLVLVESIFVLIPDQRREELGYELWVVGLIVLVTFVGTWARRDPRTRPAGAPWHWEYLPLAIAVLSSLPTVIGGASLIAGGGGGLYWLAVGLVVAFAGAIVNAWVLLVEIVR